MDIPPFHQRPHQQSQQQLGQPDETELMQDDFDFNNLRKRKGQIIHCAKEHIEHGE